MSHPLLRLAPEIPGPAAAAVLSILLAAGADGPTQPSSAQDHSLPAVHFTERLDSDLVLIEVWQGELRMTDYYPLDYVLHAHHELSATLWPGAAESGDRRLVEYTWSEGEQSIGGEGDPGEGAALESPLDGVIVAFTEEDGIRLVEGDEALEPLLTALRDGFDRRDFGPPADLGAEPSWTLRDAEALALFDATGPLGLRFDDQLDPTRSVIVLTAPFELRALLESAEDPRAELVLTRGVPADATPRDEPLKLDLKADGVSDLVPILQRIARQVGDSDMWEGITLLDATWSLEAKGEAQWDAERQVLRGIELEGELTVSAELTFQPNDSALQPSTFVLDIAGTVSFASEHLRN